MPPFTIDSTTFTPRGSSPDTFYDAVSVASPSFKHTISFTETTRSEIDQDIFTQQTSFETRQISSIPDSTQMHPTIDSFSESDLEKASGTTDVSTARPSLNGQESSSEEKHSDASTWLAPISHVQLEQSQLIIPKSKYNGYTPPYPPSKERHAIIDLLAEHGKDGHSMSAMRNFSPTGSEEFTEFELSSFSIYLPESRHHSFEMRGLQHLATKQGHSSFLLDGILTCGNLHRYVQAVPFKICSIGNYGENHHEVGSDIWIQSDLNSTSDIYYRLGSPAAEYRRFHDGFLWLADMAKHFVDYCQSSEKPVSVRDFTSKFYKWVCATHHESPRLQPWLDKYGHTDFRRVVAVNISFLFKEAVGVEDELRSHPVFNELLEKDAVPMQEIVEEKTIVTPFVYDCFNHLRFGHHLEMVDPVEMTKTRQLGRNDLLDLTGNEDIAQFPSARLSPRYVPSIETPDEQQIQQKLDARNKMLAAIKVGDVLSVTKDGADSVWKDEVSRWKAADTCWYAYVQVMYPVVDGDYKFDVIWLYKPSDTACAKMKYPFSNELFFSDLCTCLRSTMRISEDEIIDIVNVDWHGHPSTSQNFFIRQTYLENERFVTFQDAHKICQHNRNSGQNRKPLSEASSKYPIGQTVLAVPNFKSKHGLEPFEVVKHVLEGPRKWVICRRLHRRQELDGKGRPNELAYTDKMHKISAKKIEQTCLVRFYTESDVSNNRIPAPYCRDGQGNAFYITSKLVETRDAFTLDPIDNDHPQSLMQGFDPAERPEREVLRGMDLYCGGGNFGRGLEEGEAVHNEWAVDINKNAIATYFANLKEPASTKLFYGSVNDMIHQAMKGNPKNSDLIPLPGDVEFISAGSPCQGFSTLNCSRNNERGLRNQSLVASVASYIDFYRPKYGLLENVMNMAQKGLGRDEDVLSQLLCAIVGMGYQVQLFVLDAWSCGHPQSRSRLFVSFAAPGLVPLEHPALSHSHPPGTSDRGLGVLANGQSFGRRIHCLTPFEYVTSGQGTSDLPKIGDGHTYNCIREPDHVMAMGISTDLKMQIDAIPTKPRGMNFAKSWNEGRGVMKAEQRKLFGSMITNNGQLRENAKPGSRAWGRIKPTEIFPTIVVSLSAYDARLGNVLHWDENRVITTMEGKRAQGFPDEEVLVGSATEGWKILGNSVARGVAMSLGLSLRKAWLQNDPDLDSKLVAPRVRIAVHSVRSPVQSRQDQKLLQPSKRICGVVVPVKSPSSKYSHPPIPQVLKGSKVVFESSESECDSSESSESEEELFSASKSSQKPDRLKARETIVIPDSIETSDDEAASAPILNDHNKQKSFASALALRISKEQERNAQKKRKAEKRPHDMFRESHHTPQQNRHKFPRVVVPSSSRSQGRNTLPFSAGTSKPQARPQSRKAPETISLLASDDEAPHLLKLKSLKSKKYRILPPPTKYTSIFNISAMIQDEAEEMYPRMKREAAVHQEEPARAVPTVSNYVEGEPIDENFIGAYKQTHNFFKRSDGNKLVKVGGRR